MHLSRQTLQNTNPQDIVARPHQRCARVPAHTAPQRVPCTLSGKTPSSVQNVVAFQGPCMLLCLLTMCLAGMRLVLGRHWLCVSHHTTSLISAALLLFMPITLLFMRRGADCLLLCCGSCFTCERCCCCGACCCCCPADGCCADCCCCSSCCLMSLRSR